MGMTMTQKILAHGAGLEYVKPGQLIKAKLDLVLGNDITTPVAINEFEKAGFDGVFDKSKISLVMDHFVPNKDIRAAQQTKHLEEGMTTHFSILAWRIPMDRGVWRAIVHKVTKSLM